MPTPTPPPVPTPIKGDERRAFWKALNLAWEMGFVIAVPAFLFGFGGAYLDKLWGTTPLLMFGGLALAAVSSAITIYKRVRDVLSDANG